MASKAVDITNLTVDDLFRAKEERRRRLARLPFDQKIAIVKKLQTIPAVLKDEKLIFESFLKACPDLEREIQEWDLVEDWYIKRALEPPPHPFDNRPDIIAVAASGRRIGIELKSWVNRDQIAKARKQERIQENILKAIGQPPNKTRHIGKVELSAKQYDARDDLDFKRQLSELIEHIDIDWPKRFDPNKPPFLYLTDFAGFQILEKSLRGVRFRPKDRTNPKRWILFPESPYPHGHYSPNDMRETLRSALLIHRSDERYKDLRTQASLDEVYLLVHYDFKAFAYNTPFDAPNFGFKEAATFASSVLNGDGGYFDRIFLFHFLWGKEEAYRIL